MLVLNWTIKMGKKIKNQLMAYRLNFDYRAKCRGVLQYAPTQLKNTSDSKL
jgi:hypothetical protein